MIVFRELALPVSLVVQILLMGLCVVSLPQEGQAVFGGLGFSLSLEAVL